MDKSRKSNQTYRLEETVENYIRFSNQENITCQTRVAIEYLMVWLQRRGGDVNLRLISS